MGKPRNGQQPEMVIQELPIATAPGNSESEDDGIEEGTEINRLLDEGYSVKQIVDLGFKRRTVFYHAKKRTKPENNSVASSEQSGINSMLPAKLEGRQVIVPEFLIKHLSFIDEDKKQAAVDMVLIWEAARRSVMEDVMILQGLTTAQAQTTETQLKILREAKSESKEVARIAAEEAAMMVGGQIREVVQQQQNSVKDSPNPMASMFTQAVQPYFSQALGKMFSMFGTFGQPGGNMPPQSGQTTGSPAQSGQQASAQQSGSQPIMAPPGARQVSDKEMEEAFND